MFNSTVVPANSQPVFNFGDNQVRVIVRDGEPWFVATDVCRALGYRDAEKGTRNLSNHQKADTQIVGSSSGGVEQLRKVTIINESGLYRLVLRSRKPEAEKFSDWVTGEVLPTIRKTGQYQQPVAQTAPAIDYARISPAQAQDLKEIVAAIVQAGIQGYGETWARFQRKFKVNSYLELPATQHLEARAYLLAKLPKGDAGATIEQPAPLPSLDPFNTQAMAAASKQAREYFDAARQGKYTDATAIPPEVLCGLLAQAMLEQRFMLSFDRDTGRMNIKPMPADAFVLSWPQFARGVVTNDIMATNTELAELAAACNHRLAQRLTA